MECFRNHSEGKRWADIFIIPSNRKSRCYFTAALDGKHVDIESMMAKTRSALKLIKNFFTLSIFFLLQKSRGSCSVFGGDFWLMKKPTSNSFNNSFFRQIECQKSLTLCSIIYCELAKVSDELLLARSRWRSCIRLCLRQKCQIIFTLEN